MKRNFVYISLLGFLFLSFIIESHNGIKYPDYFPEPIYDFEKNPISPEKISLGRALFYDPLLSKDNSISCASCHSVFNAFAHTDHDLSHGIDDQIGMRNAPALMNLAWHTSFMWDGAVNHLDMQALAPMEHPKEMGEQIGNVIQKLNDSTLYPKLFFKAFQDSLATGERMLKAMAQFQLKLVSANSKYDKVKRGETTFTDQEENGYRLFKQNCNSCHKEPLFTTGKFKNNGLPIDSTLKDLGRMNVTKKISDSRKFKIPTLRNVEYSYPYMHDGRFQSLSAVIKHYTNNIENNETLASELLNSIELNSNERVDLIAFLLTLSDKDFVFNREFRYPKEIFRGASKLD